MFNKYTEVQFNVQVTITAVELQTSVVQENVFFEWHRGDQVELSEKVGNITPTQSKLECDQRFTKKSNFFRNIHNGVTSYLEKWATLKLYATFNQPPTGTYPALLGQATFDLKNYINKRSEKVKLPLTIKNERKGSVNCIITIIPLEEKLPEFVPRNTSSASITETKQELAKDNKEETKHEGPQLPKDFYQRVMELELEVEKEREKAKKETIMTLIDLFNDALGYFATVDDDENCHKWTMHMQQFTTKPHVLKVLDLAEVQRVAAMDDGEDSEDSTDDESSARKTDKRKRPVKAMHRKHNIENFRAQKEVAIQLFDSELSK